MKSVKTKRTEYNGTEYWTCCFCEEIFTGFGNNPDTHRDDDECCEQCTTFSRLEDFNENTSKDYDESCQQLRS